MTRAGTEVVLKNGRIPGNDSLVDVIVNDGLVAGLERPGVISRGTAFELDGRFVLPGLWDEHVHFTQWAQHSKRLDLSSAQSAAEVVELVRAAIADGSREVIGGGFRDGLWADAPSTQLLDAVCGGAAEAVPVFLVSGDLHSCWLNSAALAIYAPGDHPTGLLREDDCFAAVRALDNLPEETRDEWVADAARAAAARGVVGIRDFEMAWNLEPWVRRMHAGFDTLRVEFGIYTQDLERAIAEGLRTGDPVAGTNEMLRVGPYKVITDGSLNTRTAYCFDAYRGLEGTDAAHGQLNVPPEQLLALMRRAAASALEPAVHAIGDHANALALDAFAALGSGGSIEHAQLLNVDDVRRFAALGVRASVQPEHAMDDRDVADHYWADRTDRAFMLRSLVEAGAVLALGSDAPVAPLDPWVAIAAAVGRSRDGRQPWHGEQSLTVLQALKASTRGRGAVSVGDVADIAVVEFDPFDCEVDQLRQMPVALTVVGGRITHNVLQN